MLAVVALLLCGCGSRVDPATVARAGGASGDGGSGGDVVTQGQGAGDPVAGDNPVPAGQDDSGVAGASGGGGTGPASGTTAGGPQNPTRGVKAGSCAGFENQKGITDTTIKIANVSDVSGPVPGIFESAQQATRAFVSYFNATSDICGRKLELVNLDSRADAGADQRAYVQACDEVFAAVGSMSAFDSGGAATADACGLPDIRSVITSPERQRCRTCAAAYPATTNLVPTSIPRFFQQRFPAAVKKAAVLYINAGAAPVNAKSLAEGYRRGGGWTVDYLQGIDVAEFNYAPYVQQMKSRGIRAVVYYGPYQNTARLQQAMQQQGFKPDFFLQDPTIYDQRYVKQAGSLAEGTYVFSAQDLFENKANSEIQLYLSYLQQVKPGAIPNYYGLFAWSATRLFVEKAIALGGRLDRGSIAAAVKSTTSWNGNGAHTAMNIAKGTTPGCFKILEYHGGSWRQASPGDYLCGGLVDSGIGG